MRKQKALLLSMMTSCEGGNIKLRVKSLGGVLLREEGCNLAVVGFAATAKQIVVFQQRA